MKLDKLYYCCDVWDIAQDFIEWGIATRDQIADQINGDCGGIDPDEVYRCQQCILNKR